MTHSGFFKIPTELRFIGYVTGLYTSFIYWGYIQEKITIRKYPVDNGTLSWNYPFALNFFMALGAYAIAWLIERTSKAPSVPVFAFWKAALTCAVASPIGYASLNYISFPMMVLTKSSKPVPVMLIGLIFYRRRYPIYKYISVLCVCGGIALFSSVKKGGSSSSDASHDLRKLAIGVVLVLVNLTLDGYTNNAQDEIFSVYKATSLQMMKYTNLWQVVFILLYLLVLGAIQGVDSELYGAVKLLRQSSEIQWDIALFCFFASVGQILIFKVMQEFGSLVWVTISVTRKLFTILVSVFMFNHVVKPVQWAGVGSVFFGLILETIMGYYEKSKGKMALKKEE